MVDIRMRDGSMMKYLVRDNKEDIVHSSGYAKTQNGASMGATSTESFERRMLIEKNRTRVAKYNNSRIVAQTFASRPKAKPYTPPERGVGGVHGGVGGAGTTGDVRGARGGAGAASASAGNRAGGGPTAHTPAK